MMSVKQSTVQSYLEASYAVVDVEKQKTHQFRIGQPHGAIGQMLARHNAKTGLVFTAWNPHSRPTPLLRNRASNNSLLKHPLVANVGVRVYPSYGADDQSSWREEGFFFTGLGFKVAQILCLEYQQNAGVIVGREEPSQLVWHPHIRFLQQ